MMSDVASLEQALVHAMLAAQGGQWAQVTRHLSPVLAAACVRPLATGGVVMALHLMGMGLRELGQGDAARVCLETALRLEPQSVEAWNSLGNLARTDGDWEAALDAFTRATHLMPAHPAFWSNRAGALHALGRSAEAEVSLRQALAVQPDFLPALHDLAILHQNRGALAAAADLFRACLSLEPANLQYWRALGPLCNNQGQHPQALQAFRAGLRLKPDDPALLAGFGFTLRQCDEPAASAALLHRVIALMPEMAEPYAWLGNLAWDAGALVAAEALHHRAVQLDPNSKDGNWGLACCWLARGRYAAGWEAYEWRWKRPEAAARQVTLPSWQGEPLAGRTLYVQSEQGLGDTLQFLRWLPALLARADGPVVLDVQPALLRLVAPQFPGIQVIPGGTPSPVCHCTVPLLSLPRVLRQPEVGPPQNDDGNGAYLQADPVAVADWRARLDAQAQGRRKVGLVWAGSPTFGDDRRRSPRLPAVLPLLTVAGVQFFLLQMGDGRRDLEGVALPATVQDLGPEIGDFADTAAIIANLDLLISSCTAPAHLAGALGRPLWVLLAHVADWRWGAPVSPGTPLPLRSPWYPCARLFRQTRPGDWAGVVAAVKEALERPDGEAL